MGLGLSLCGVVCVPLCCCAGVDGSCNSMPQQLSPALYDPSSAVVAARFWYADMDGDTVDDIVAVLANRSIVFAKGTAAATYLNVTVLTTVARANDSSYALFDVNLDGLVDLVSGMGVWQM